MKSLLKLLLYIGFILIGIVQAYFFKNFVHASSVLSIAFLFFPFNINHWKQLQLWQKFISIFHALLLLVIFGLLMWSIFCVDIL